MQTAATDTTCLLHRLGVLLRKASDDDDVRDAVALAMERSTHAALATDACWQDLSDVALSSLCQYIETHGWKNTNDRHWKEDEMTQTPMTPRQGFDKLVSEAYDEAERAMVRFPQPNYVISKVAEEAGEVVKAAIHAAEGREILDEVRAEMRQLIAMLYRMWAEGDEVHGLAAVSGSVANQPVSPSRAGELEQVLHDIAAQAWTHPSDYETDRKVRLERIASLVRDAIGPYRGP